MNIFGLFGTNGLPPLPEDDNRRSAADTQRICRTHNCAFLAQPSSPFCGHCQVRRIGLSDAIIRIWPLRPEEPGDLQITGGVTGMVMQPNDRAALAAQEAEAIRAQAAPLFDVSWFDHRCRWCCRIMSEHAAAAAITGRVRPTRENFECALHETRRKAHDEIIAMLQYLRYREHMTCDEIAEYYRHGYLGDRLNDDQRF